MSTTGHPEAKPTIVFLDQGTISPEIEMPAPAFPHVWRSHNQCAPHDVVTRLQGAQIAITNKVPIREEHIRLLPDLRLVAVIASGTDIIDIRSAERHGISVCNVPGYARTSVAEHTMALILSLRRNLFEYRQQVISGAWQAAGQFCFYNRPVLELEGSLLGVIGTGAIARSVARRAHSFGMNILFHSPNRRRGDDIVSLTWLLRESDVVSCHTELNGRSRALLNRDAFRLMKPEAIFINTSRGEIVDEEALAEAIEQRRIAAAGIDVACEEPPPDDSPLMRICNLPNVIVTPHVGFAGVATQKRLCEMTISNIEAYVSGKPTNLVSLR